LAQLRTTRPRRAAQRPPKAGVRAQAGPAPGGITGAMSCSVTAASRKEAARPACLRAGTRRRVQVMPVFGRNHQYSRPRGDLNTQTRGNFPDRRNHPAGLDKLDAALAASPRLTGWPRTPLPVPSAGRKPSRARSSGTASRRWTPGPANGSRSCPSWPLRPPAARRHRDLAAIRPRHQARRRYRRLGNSPIASGRHQRDGLTSGPTTRPPGSGATSPQKKTAHSGPGQPSRFCAPPASASRNGCRYWLRAAGIGEDVIRGRVALVAGDG
jgi:hypothetical protein